MPSLCSTTTHDAVRTSSEVQNGSSTSTSSQSAVRSFTCVSSSATGKPSSRHSSVTLALMVSVRQQHVEVDAVGLGRTLDVAAGVAHQVDRREQVVRRQRAARALHGGKEGRAGQRRVDRREERGVEHAARRRRRHLARGTHQRAAHAADFVVQPPRGVGQRAGRARLGDVVRRRRRTAAPAAAARPASPTARPACAAARAAPRPRAPPATTASRSARRRTPAGTPPAGPPASGRVVP